MLRPGEACHAAALCRVECWSWPSNEGTLVPRRALRILARLGLFAFLNSSQQLSGMADLPNIKPDG